MTKRRCPWAEGVEEIYVSYHDEEWGVPTYDDQELFEMLVLESFQAGLAWITILKKRENFRLAFDNFDVEKVAAYDEKKIEENADKKRYDPLTVKYSPAAFVNLVGSIDELDKSK